MPIDKTKLTELDTYFSARERQLFDCFAHVDNHFDDEIQAIINPTDGSTYDDGLGKGVRNLLIPR